jgi:hypothetical protein
MKESYKVRSSQSPWPRVMRCVGQPAGRSVHRGTTGRCMELRKTLVWRPTLSDMGKAIVMSNERHGESDETPTESKTTGTVGNFPHGSRETPETSVFFHGSGSVGEGARPQFRHARYRGVRQFHSTEEAGEQGRGATACGVGGGKGTDQGEH